RFPDENANRENQRRKSLGSVVDASGIRIIHAAARNTSPYGPRTSIAVMIGCNGGRLSLTAHAATAPAAAAAHSFTTYSDGRLVCPMRAFSLRRRRSISTQPATPAEAVSPAAPHMGSIWSHAGT